MNNKPVWANDLEDNEEGQGGAAWVGFEWDEVHEGRNMDEIPNPKRGCQKSWKMCYLIFEAWYLREGRCQSRSHKCLSSISRQRCRNAVAFFVCCRQCCPKLVKSTPK